MSTDGKVRKKHVNVPCPDAVRLHNQAMGGGGFSRHANCSLSNKDKIRRWYLKVIFHCIDMTKVNAWLLYRQHCEQLHVAKKQGE